MINSNFQERERIIGRSQSCIRLHGRKMKKIFVWILIIVSAATAAFYLFGSLRLASMGSVTPLRATRGVKKLVVSWTTFFGTPLDDKYLDECPEVRENCTVTADRSLYAHADAIVFHPRNMQWNDIPPKRTPNQRYVFLMHESPPHTCLDIDFQRNFFNWSLTYRLDSDVPYPYAFRIQQNSARQELDAERILNKSLGNASVVWFVSNCDTSARRELYVAALEKYLPVDIYGACGPLKCPKAVGVQYHKLSKCEEMIESKYKFYIAFENSICTDYVTEKYHGRRDLNSVPIVLSRKVAERVFPPKSFIAVDDYPKGPGQLAEYIRYLQNNDTAYLEYFHWKKIGYVYGNRDPSTGLRNGFCGLCEKLLKLEKEQTHETKVYESVNAWWGEKASCDTNLVPRLLAKEALLDPKLAERLRRPWTSKYICGF